MFIPSLAFATILMFLRYFPEKNRNSIFPQYLDFWTFVDFLEIYKKTCAEISRKTHRRMSRDLSYETHLGPKTKMEIDPFSRPLKKLNNFLRLPKRSWDVSCLLTLGHFRHALSLWMTLRPLCTLESADI